MLKLAGWWLSSADHWYGLALQKVELDRDYVVESMEIAGRTYTQKQARRMSRGSQTRVLQLCSAAALHCRG